MNRALLVLFYVMIGLTIFITTGMRDSADLNSQLVENPISVDSEINAYK